MQRRTFAIISHPDAGKTTITEKILLFGGVINEAGSVKSRKTDQHARSDWMAIEKERGISISTSVMQFIHKNCIFNLLDTPGHEDFSEDTYRTLSAVDGALMVIDGAKGVEERTRKLMEVCRMRDIPIITFINKLDRSIQDPLELLDDIENSLGIKTHPLTWPIGMGKDFLGVYDCTKKHCFLYKSGYNFIRQDPIIASLEQTKESLSHFDREALNEALELVASEPFDHQAYLKGQLTPVYFGSALNNFGIKELLDGFALYAPSPLSRESTDGVTIHPNDEEFVAFVFKIQANMDLNHRDRVAFCRVCSGTYEKGQKIFHVQSQKYLSNTQALSFMGQDRTFTNQAVAGDIIGLINHGNIHIGDTFCIKKRTNMKIQGIVRFAPELFKSVRSEDPLKSKQLNHALAQLSQEGAVQVFRKKIGNDLILGAVGHLQFDVVISRLKHEYQLSCIYQHCPFVCALWIESESKDILELFVQNYASQIAYDAYEKMIFLAQSKVQMDLIRERNPKILFIDKEDC